MSSNRLNRIAASSATPVTGGREGKILNLDQLAETAAQYRRSGMCIVQCHGTFDLLHIGHVRHLEAARRLGDVLVVTVTADNYVNKGPGRPVFNENLRAEMLSQLEIVDHVAINTDYDSINALKAVQPDIYVKGQDYKNPDGDLTGKIQLEIEAVESYGGRIEFTEEIVFSSSNLINQHLNVYEPHVSLYLNGLRNEETQREIDELFETVKDFRVLLIGETIIDEYKYVLPIAKAAKENIIATRYEDTELFFGGVIATAHHLASFCREIDVISVAGNPCVHADRLTEILPKNVHLHLLRRKNTPTIRKSRFVDKTHFRKLFEVYYMDDAELPHEMETEVISLITAKSKDCDAIVINDFGHGFIGPAVVDVLAGTTPFLSVNTQSNSGNLGFNLVSKYPRADFVCLDALEARLATGEKHHELTEIVSICLPNLIKCERFIVTQGQYGCVVSGTDGLVHTIPAFTDHVIDTIGAGDALFAVGSLLAAAGARNELIGFIGNVAGAQKVRIIGHRSSIDKVTLLKSINTLLK